MGKMRVSPLVKVLICNLAIPIVEVIINRIESKVKDTPNEYDDIGLDVVRQVLLFVKVYLCEDSDEDDV